MEKLLVTPEVRENGLGTVDPDPMAPTIEQVVQGFDLQVSPTVAEVFDDSFLPELSQGLVS